MTGDASETTYDDTSNDDIMRSNTLDGDIKLG